MNETNVIRRKTKKCLCCNRLLIGRKDKLFCDDRCRNNFYYLVNMEQKSYIRRINRALLKNRGILKTLNPSGRKTVPKKLLDDMGFDFGLFTGVYKTKKGKEYYLVYDQAFSIKDDKVCLLVFYSDAQSVVS